MTTSTTACIKPLCHQPASLRRSGGCGLYLAGRLEQILGQHRYLTGNQLTEADIRLWTTLVRFDPVYVTHFKCDKRRISDYLNLYGFLRDIYQMPGIAER